MGRYSIPSAELVANTMGHTLTPNGIPVGNHTVRTYILRDAPVVNTTGATNLR